MQKSTKYSKEVRPSTNAGDQVFERMKKALDIPPRIGVEVSETNITILEQAVHRLKIAAKEAERLKMELQSLKTELQEKRSELNKNMSGERYQNAILKATPPMTSSKPELRIANPSQIFKKAPPVPPGKNVIQSSGTPTASAKSPPPPLTSPKPNRDAQLFTRIQKVLGQSVPDLKAGENLTEDDMKSLEIRIFKMAEIAAETDELKRKLKKVNDLQVELKNSKAIADDFKEKAEAASRELKASIVERETLIKLVQEMAEANPHHPNRSSIYATLNDLTPSNPQNSSEYDNVVVLCLLSPEILTIKCVCRGIL